MRRALLLGLALIAAPLAAKDSLGVFGEWAAFQAMWDGEFGG